MQTESIRVKDLMLLLQTTPTIPKTKYGAHDFVDLTTALHYLFPRRLIQYDMRVSASVELAFCGCWFKVIISADTANVSGDLLSS